MRAYSIVFFALTLLFACTKSDDPIDDPNPVETPIPPSTPVNTAITAYTVNNNQASNPVYLYINNNLTFWDLWSYSTNTVSSVDKYNSNIGVRNSLTATIFFDNYRNFPVTSSSRNYVDVNNIPKVSVGGLTYASNGGEWQLPGGGKITYAPYSFGNYSGGSNGGSTYFAFLNPTSKYYSITNPSFTVDKDQKRYYLKSFGIIYVSTPYPIASDGDVRIEHPIPSSLLSVAPDSIPAWLYSDNKWLLKGYAKKISGSYTMKLDVMGTWNFALPVKGFYKTIKLRTSAGIPVTNAILRIKNNIGQVGAARTDVDGNAICFLPAAEDLVMEIPHGWNDPPDLPPAFVLPLTSFNNPDDITFTLPSSSPYVMTIKGNADICNAGPIQDGTVTITNRSGLILCSIPITNGKYSSALISENARIIYIIKALNSATSATGTDTAAAMGTGVDNVINLTTCQTATNLFLNYSIDGVSYSITGDASQPHNPHLTAYYNQNGTTMISCNSDPGGTGNGLDFTAHFFAAGVFNSMGFSNVWVNSVYYQHDFNKPGKLIITRYDLLPGGYIEGSADFYYKDNSNVSHHVVANFRLKRIS